LDNTSTGFVALEKNTTAKLNTANGVNALNANSTAVRVSHRLGRQRLRLPYPGFGRCGLGRWFLYHGGAGRQRADRNDWN
jgi:hypothetical protein